MDIFSASQSLITSSTLIAQGAEAKVYKGRLFSTSNGSATGGVISSDEAVDILIKHRFTKSYRHPSLDTTITKARVAGEARALMRCLRAGINVPAIRMVDASEGVIGLEWIDGSSVRKLIPGAVADGEDLKDDDESPNPQPSSSSSLDEYGVSIDQLMVLIGQEIAKLHLVDLVHGDLTTSNMMLRRLTSSSPVSSELVLIDFGLSYQSTLIEDKAVDLYVLERAFNSTHPESEPMFAKVLEAYGEKLDAKEKGAWVAVKTRLDEVRLRGRKRDMVG